MATFNARCLIKLGDYRDIKEIKSALKKEGRTEDDLVAFEEGITKELIENLIDYSEDTSAVSGCWPVDYYMACDRGEHIIFGCKSPDELITFAAGMERATKNTAKALIESSFHGGKLTEATTILDSVNLIETDSTDTYRLAQAFDMLDRNANIACSVLFFEPNNSAWQAWPDRYALEEIEGTPEEWCIIELAFD